MKPPVFAALRPRVAVTTPKKAAIPMDCCSHVSAGTCLLCLGLLAERRPLPPGQPKSKRLTDLFFLAGFCECSSNRGVFLSSFVLVFDVEGVITRMDEFNNDGPITGAGLHHAFLF